MSRPLATRSARSSLTVFGILAILAIVVASCSTAAAPVAAPADQRDSNPGTDTTSGSAGQPQTNDGSGGTQNGSTGGSAGFDQNGNQVPQTDVSRPDLQIIKTGTMSLQVPDLDAALASASSKVTALGGYVSGSDRHGDGDQSVASATYRIPSASWDTALVQLRAIGAKVLAEQTQTQDVTGTVADLGAQISNLQATELALQGIMAKATKISDILSVEQQLSSVQGQIEQLSTQKKHLEDQASYSTMTVSFSLVPQPAVVTTTKQFDPNATVDDASASLVGILQGLATAGIWFAIVWLPILVVVGILGAIVVAIVRRLAPRRSDDGGGPIVPAATEG